MSSIKELERLSFIFFGAVIVGLIILLFLPKGLETNVDNYVYGLLNNYKSREYSFETGLVYVIVVRFRMFLCILFAVLTFKEKSLYMILIYFGICWGIVSGEVYRFFGINGILICFFLIIPHYIFYLMGIIGNFLLIKILRNMSQNRKIRLFSMSIAIIILVLVGCVVENYVNLKILPKIN